MDYRFHEPRSPTFQTGSLPSEPPGKLHKLVWFSLKCSGEILKRISVLSTHPKQYRRHKWWAFNPWNGKIPLSRKWQPTPVCLPGKFHAQRNLVAYSPWRHKESGTTEWLSVHKHTHTDTHTDTHRHTHTHTRLYKLNWLPKTLTMMSKGCHPRLYKGRKQGRLIPII